MRRCITNLVNNACNHAGLVHIGAQFNATRDMVNITIDDNGVGIPEEKLEEVFRPFYRLMMRATRKPAAQASGLLLRAMWRAAMAAISSCQKVRLAAYGQPSQCRF